MSYIKTVSNYFFEKFTEEFEENGQEIINDLLDSYDSADIRTKKDIEFFLKFLYTIYGQILDYLYQMRIDYVQKDEEVRYKKFYEIVKGKKDGRKN